MPDVDTVSSAPPFPPAAPGAGEGRYTLRLYVAGNSPNSVRAVANTKSICEEFLRGRYELEVVDIYQDPAAAVAGQVVAVPTLVKVTPAPERRLIGNMSGRERVLAGFGLTP